MKNPVTHQSAGRSSGKNQEKPLRTLWDWILYARPTNHKTRRGGIRKLKKLFHYVILFLTLIHLVSYSLYVIEHGEKFKKEILDSRISVAHINNPV